MSGRVIEVRLTVFPTRLCETKQGESRETEQFIGKGHRPSKRFLRDFFKGIEAKPDGGEILCLIKAEDGFEISFVLREDGTLVMRKEEHSPPPASPES